MLDGVIQKKCTQLGNHCVFNQVVNVELIEICSDDNQILSWSVSNTLPTKLTDLNPDLYPTDMQFLPRVSGTLGKQGDLILITSVDGKFHIMNRTGRIERTVDAHKGAILVGQWSNDGTGLLTGTHIYNPYCLFNLYPTKKNYHSNNKIELIFFLRFSYIAGEDGFIKIWSRSGMLRSTVVSSDNSVYGACWSPDSQSIAYTQGKCVVVKQLAPNTKPLRVSPMFLFMSL